MFGEYMVYYKAVPVLLVCDDCVFVKILKETTELLGEDCEQEIPYDGANCITYWILIIPILQGKRLLPYIIAEKTSQRNQNSNVFICPSFRAFLFIFSYCCAVFRKECSLWKRVVFCLPGIKIKIINIW